MKKDLHPTYQEKVTVKCSCGNSFETGSTEKTLDIEVCSACHPFYTGKSKLVDAAGRVDKFRKKLKEVATSREKAPRHTKKTKGKGKVVKLG